MCLDFGSSEVETLPEIAFCSFVFGNDVDVVLNWSGKVQVITCIIKYKIPSKASSRSKRIVEFTAIGIS